MSSSRLLDIVHIRVLDKPQLQHTPVSPVAQAFKEPFGIFSSPVLECEPQVTGVAFGKDGLELGRILVEFLDRIRN